MKHLTALALSIFSSLSLFANDVVQSQPLPSKASQLYEAITSDKNALSWKKEALRSNIHNLDEALDVCIYNKTPRHLCVTIIKTSVQWIPVIAESKDLRQEIKDITLRIEFNTKLLYSMSDAEKLEPVTAKNTCLTSDDPCDN